MKVVQRRPNYFTGFEDEVAEYSTLDELFSVEFVRRFSEHENFLKYSLSLKSTYADKDWPDFLMAEYHDGTKHSWWVIAHLYDNTLDIPLFVSTYPVKEIVKVVDEPSIPVYDPLYGIEDE